MIIKEIINENVEILREIDYYVPLTITFKDNEDIYSQVYYYKIVNNDYSYIEIAVDSLSGKIIRIAIISINRIKNSCDFSLSGIEKLTGNPVIDLDIFDVDGFATEQNDFFININDDSITIIFEGATVDKSINYNNFKIFLNRKNKIVGFLFSKFSEQDLNELNDEIVVALNTVNRNSMSKK